MMAPCKGCPDRHTACHDSCDAYKEWLDLYHAAKKQLEIDKNRWKIPMTYARQKAYDEHYPDLRSNNRQGGVL